MPTYIVKSPLAHDGVNYAVDETVDIPAKAAKPLMDLGVVAPTKPAGAAKKSETTGTSAE